MLSIHHSAPLPPAPVPFNLAAYVLGAGADERIALQIVSPTGAERWSYGRLRAAVAGIGTGFLRMGLQPGERVLLRLGNTVEFPLAFLGAVGVGLVPVPTSAQLTQHEITPMAATLGPAAVVAGPGIALPDHPAPVISDQMLRDWQDLPPAPFDMGAPDRPGYMVFTSGTSGRARAVVHAHRAVWARRMMWQGWYDLTADDRLMHAGAFNWTYTLGTGLMDPWAIGACALIPAQGVTPAQLPLLMRRFDATIFAAAPGVYRQMLKSPPAPMPRLRHGLSAGEKLPEALKSQWHAATGTPLFEALGMSECSTFISASPARPAPEGATGYAQPGRHIAVLDDSLTPVPRGEGGERAVSRDDPGLFLGYWQAEEETRARLKGDWFLTGDQVVMAEDGAITYLGRKDDMLNAGGFRVSPLEIERTFETHPGILEAAAIAYPLREGVEVIALAYVPASAPLPQEALESFAQGHLARYKQPRLYRAVAALPRGANNKLDRRRLRLEAWT